MSIDLEKIRQREIDRINEERKQIVLEQYTAAVVKAIKSGKTDKLLNLPQYDKMT
jgi:hypothetical protein